MRMRSESARSTMHYVLFPVRCSVCYRDLDSMQCRQSAVLLRPIWICPVIWFIGFAFRYISLTYFSSFPAYSTNSLLQISIRSKNMQFIERLAFLLSWITQLIFLTMVINDYK